MKFQRLTQPDQGVKRVSPNVLQTPACDEKISSLLCSRSELVVLTSLVILVLTGMLEVAYETYENTSNLSQGIHLPSCNQVSLISSQKLLPEVFNVKP